MKNKINVKPYTKLIEVADRERLSGDWKLKSFILDNRIIETVKLVQQLIEENKALKTEIEKLKDMPGLSIVPWD